MPRAGGDSNKLGNQYESFWTVECFLDVVVGKARGITVESFGPESEGVEFHLRADDNSRTFYSSKRQNQRALGWSVNDLCKPDKKTSRSILGDLFQKVINNECDRAVFVSASGANHLREIIERAENATSFMELDQFLSKTLRGKLANELLPVVGNDKELVLRCLKATEVISRQHDDQKRITERQIESTLYRVDGEQINSDDIRLIISEFILENLGPEITTEYAREFVASKGLALRDWKSDTAIHDKVAATNDRFFGIAESELINQSQIARNESEQIVELIEDEDSGGALVVAAGGWGKSCIVAQVAKSLVQKSIPFLAIKLDSLKPCETTRQLGQQLDLPASPVTVLAGVADGEKSVLIVDQLDAMSLVSGRNPMLWEVFRQLRDEVKEHPNVKFVLACRDFDLEHDHRLRQLGDQNSGFKKYPIGKLTKDEVTNSIKSAGVILGFVLSDFQLEILGVPFHLLLFLLGEPNKNFSSVGELYDRYWKRKQENLCARLGREPNWNNVIDRLTDRMSRDQTLIAPKVVVEDWEKDAENMASENVLIPLENNRSYRFFHESFFDYAYARRFCAAEKSIVEFLSTDEQHLFRRSQVRQILAFRRENDETTYLRDLKEIFDSEKVRFHIKRMVASQLRLIEKPTQKEWNLVEDYFHEGKLSRFVSGAMRNHKGWFDRLNGEGVIAGWLGSEDEELVKTAIWLLGQSEIHDERSSEIAALLAPYRDKGEIWQKRIQNTLTWGNAYKSEEMASIFLGLVADGAYDDFHSEVVGSDFWSHLHEVEVKAPKFLIDVLAAWLIRALAIYDDGESWGFLDQYGLNTSHSGASMVLKAAELEPKHFVEKLLPIAVNGIKSTEVETGSRMSNRIWSHLSNNGDPFRIDNALLLGLRKSLQFLSANEPQSHREFTSGIADLPHDTIAYWLLRSWTDNPNEFADDCAKYLVANPQTQHLGYSSWSSNDDKGTGHCAIGRIAIKAISPCCSNLNFQKLEESVLDHLNDYEKGNPRSRGFYQLLVLRSLDANRMSQKTQLRIEELERKFPHAPDAIVVEDETSLASFVGPPIPSEKSERMNDAQWISSMKRYGIGSGRSLKGGVVEHSRLLREFANKDRSRFSALVDQMDDSIDPMYFSAILDGLCGRQHYSTPEEKDEDEKLFAEFSTEIVVQVIERLHKLPDRPCGTAIAHCISKLAKRELPDEILEVVKHYAINSPDPSEDIWQREGYCAGSPYTHGINCVRGQFAEAIAALLWEDRDRLECLKPAIDSIVNDPIISVRTCGIRALLPLLNFQKDEGVRLFLVACKGCEDICGTPPFDRFLHFSIESHYRELRPLVQLALNSENTKAVKNAARQLILADLGDSNAEIKKDAEAVRSGNETMRRVAVETYAHNIEHKVVGDQCADFLRKFFEDESDEVCERVANVFFKMSGERLLELEPFVEEYIDSKCFGFEPDRLLWSLEGSLVKLPRIVCKAAERVLQVVSEREASDIAYAGASSAYKISKLVVRQYEQTSNPDIKRQCLDLIDQMEKVGYLGMGDELNKLDRN